MANLREILQSVYEERGKLTPALVVETARDESHPLHSRFEWDDAVAGELYRLEQASALIRSVKVKYADTPDGPKSVRSFIAVAQEDSRSANYTPVEDVLADPITRRIVLRDMEREWRSFKARYEHLVEFSALIQREAKESA